VREPSGGPSWSRPTVDFTRLINGTRQARPSVWLSSVLTDRRYSRVSCCCDRRNAAVERCGRSPIPFLRHATSNMFLTCFGENSLTFDTPSPGRIVQASGSPRISSDPSENLVFLIGEMLLDQCSNSGAIAQGGEQWCNRQTGHRLWRRRQRSPGFRDRLGQE